MNKLPRIFAILLGGLSLFRLASLIIEFRISEVITQVLKKYEYVLAPIRFVLEKPLNFIFTKLDFALPEGWVHFVFLWLLVGAICDRALTKVDEHNPDIKPSSWIINTLTSIGFSLLGFVLLIDIIFTWLKYEMILGTSVYINGQPVSAFIILAREAFYVIMSTILFFALNSFLV